MFATSTLLALALALPSAEAGTATKVKSGRIIQNTTTNAGDIVVVTSGDGAGEAVSADLGEESVLLEPTDAWMHGGAALSGLPETKARATLVLYDASSKPLAAFGGSLAADGSVTLSALSETVDVAVMAAEVFPAEGGYTLGIDLQGADVADVAYADLSVTDEKGATVSEVGWDGLGTVWKGGPLDLHKDVRAKIKIEVVTTSSRVAVSTPIGQATLALGAPWDDGRTGVSALPLSGDALTTVAIAGRGLIVVSDGWSSADALPAEAEIALDGGDTLLVPANSYQSAAAQAITFTGSPEKEAFQVYVDGVALEEGVSIGTRGICHYGRCFALTQAEDGAWTLSATAYAADPADLPAKVTVALTPTLGAARADEKSYTFTFDDRVAVVFASAFAWSGDPVGVGLAGEIALLGEADARGRQEALGGGGFVGRIGRGEEGALGLSSADKNAVDAIGDILAGGEAVRTEPPAILLHTSSGGYGTRSVATTTNGKPGLL